MSDSNEQVIKAVLTKAAETMELCAKHFRDQGEKKYEAKRHAEAMGFCIKQAIKGGMEPSTNNLTALCHALYNHSAWRQKWEGKGYFAKAEKRSVEMVESELDAEFGEE